MSRLAPLKHLLAVVLACALLLAGGFAVAAKGLAPSGPEETPAHFAVLAFRPKPETQRRWQPVVDYLNQAGLKRKFVLDVWTYPELEEAVKQHRVDVILTQPAHYVLLAQREGLYSPLATLVERQGGLAISSFGGAIVTLSSRQDIRSLADLRGKRIAATARESLGGYQAQAFELLQLGIEPTTHFQLLETGMPHDRAVEAVLSGAADAGFVRTGVLEQLGAEGRMDVSRLKVLKAANVPDYPQALSTRLYPEWALAAMPWVDTELAREVASALLSMPWGGTVAQGASIQGFTIPGNYRGVDDVMRALRAPPYDKVGRYGLREFWSQYQGVLSLIAVAISLLLLGMLFALRQAHRRLRQEHEQLELAGQELHAASMRQSALLNSLGEGVVGINTQGICTFVNPAALQLLGFREDEVLGLDIHTLCHHHHADGSPHDRNDCPIRQTLEDGQPRMGEDWFWTKDDKTGFPVRLTVTPKSYGGCLEGAVVAFSDIREQRQILQELAQHRAHLEQRVADRTAELERTMRQARDNQFALDRAGIGAIWVEMESGRIIYCNQHAAEMLGYTQTEMLALHVPEFNTNHDSVDVLEVSRSVREQGQVRFETTHRHKDGHLIPVEVALFYLPGSADQPARIVSFIMDITQRRRSEAILAMQAARAQSLLELNQGAEHLNEVSFMQRALAFTESLTGSRVSFMHLVHDDQENLELVTWSAETLNGYCHAAYEKHYPVSAAGIWADAVRRRAPVIFNDYAGVEGRKGLPAGHAPLTRLMSVPVLEKGKVVLLAGVGNKPEPYDDHDLETMQLIINEVWQTIQKQRTMSQLQSLSMAVEQSGESIVITDTQARIEYVNQAFVEETGYSLAEVRGKNPRILQSGRTSVATFASLWSALRQGRSWKGELYNRNKEGVEFIEMASISPVHQPDGTVTHYVAVKRDITQRKIMEQALEAAKLAAEAASRAKGEFLANMSHEIRTPLNAVLGMARIGYRDSEGRGKARATFGRILDSGKHLLGVINDILDFSKIEAGKFSVEVRPFRLLDVVANAESFIAGSAREKGLGFCVVGAEGLPEWVLGDAQRLQQILVNLFSNAVKFTHQGEVRLELEQSGERMEFKVSDTGIGLSEEQLGRLFTPFEQADSSTTRNFGGTGLGLTISQRLAHLMGGDITVRSRLGAGSTFTLGLPLPAAEAPAHVRVPMVPSERSLAGYRVLVAEDVDLNRLIIEDMLLEAGAEDLVFAENGRLALEAVSADPTRFDVVLMDVQMPVMDGHEATRQIVQLAPRLPVIGLTAHAMAEERERGLAAGMVDHVTKPVDPAVLIAAILRVAPPVHAETESCAFHVEAGGLTDWEALEANYTPALIGVIVNKARARLRDEPGKLRAAAEAGRLDELVGLAHRLKGVAANFYTEEVRNLAARLEMAAKAGQEDTRALSEQLAALAERWRNELEAHEARLTE